MPKQTRWRIKQTLEQAHGNVETAQDYLVKLGKEFEAVHPDYYEAFCVIVQALEHCNTAIKQMLDII